MRSSARLLAAIGGPIALSGRAGIERLRAYLSTPLPAAFEQGPDTPVEPRIHFQPRLWVRDDAAAGEADAVNTERVDHGARVEAGIQ